jgi:uncharacterized cysteine cluster protein YcgN (CxxCxxCC family)
MQAEINDYWNRKTLAEMTPTEWEALCDGCGWCCVHKIQDIETDEVFYTNVVCKYLDMHRCQCTDYEHRHELVPTCVLLTTELIPKLTWLPATCAYRLVNERKDLPDWHYLKSGSDYTVHKQHFSVRDHVISERDIDMEHLEDFVVD